MKDQPLNKNHRFGFSRREFLGHAGAIGLGYAFLRGSSSIARAAPTQAGGPLRHPGLIFETFEAGGISHYSYFIGDHINGTAVVIDPKRDVDDYLGLARKHRLRITHVLETHVHADFVSGLRELVDQTGAVGCASVEGNTSYGFPVKPLRDGDIIETGNIRLKAIFTPGHTPEHMSFLAQRKGRKAEAWALFTGDFLFAGSVGRPGLMGVENTGELTEKLWHSLQNSFTDLPDELPIFPAHGEGSPCGAGIQERDEPPTLGTERRLNPALQFKDEKTFREDLLWSQPPVPYYWPRMKEINARGPEILGSVPEPQELDAKEFETAIRSRNIQLLDTRHFLAFGGGHISGATNIGHSSSISMWGGWLLDPDRPLALVTPDEGTALCPPSVVSQGMVPRKLETPDSASAQQVARWLVRVGITKFTGVLKGGMSAWTLSGRDIDVLEQMSIHRLKERLNDPNLQLLDVRSPREWDFGHLPGARYIYLPELRERFKELDPSRPVVTYCGTGYRASIAASLLKKEGLNVRSVPGSYDAWMAAEYPIKIPAAIGKASDTRRA